MAANTEALIAEIKSDLSKYDSAGLLDTDSMYRDIVLGLKGFGNDITKYKQEKIIQVNGGYAELPQGFFSLCAAFACDPLYYKCNGVEVDSLQTSFFYKERVERSVTWNECDANCCQQEEEKIIRENIYFKGGSVDFYYHQPRLLKLGASFKRELCDNDCRNKVMWECPDEIVILDYKKLQANFNTGTIYMIWRGLPLDENGIIEVPETANGKLESYLEYYLKRRCAEKLMANNDNQGLSNLYQIYTQREEILKGEARYELRMEKLTPAAMQAIKRRNKNSIIQYETSGDWNW